MKNTKKVWIDNTVPSTEYIWMKTDLNKNLLGVYEWIAGKWCNINIDPEHAGYTKDEIDRLLLLFERQIKDKIEGGEYNIPTVTIDAVLSPTSTNAIQNKAVKQALDSKQNTISDLNAIRTGAAKGNTAVQPEDLSDFITSEDLPDVSDFITKSVNDLVNYYTKTETYTKDEVANLIGTMHSFSYLIVNELPQSGETNILYLLGPIGDGSDKYEEYVYSNNEFVKIGDTSINLSGYVTTQMLNTALGNKADSIHTHDDRYYTQSEINSKLSEKEDVITDLADIRYGAALGDTAYQKPEDGIPLSDLDESCFATESQIRGLFHPVPGDGPAILQARYMIEYNLTNVTSSNDATEIVGFGRSYETTISCSFPYTISNIQITMDDIDITTDVVTNPYDLMRRTINIPNVTGYIVITAVATSTGGIVLGP